LGEIVKNLESLEESKRYSALTVGILKEKLIKVIHYQLLDKDTNPFLLYENETGPVPVCGIRPTRTDELGH
jgi:hypothetical protein